MPELPEVETVMRGLQLRLEGRILRRAVTRRPDLRWPLPPGLVERLTGARVTSFRRRAKYILMRLDSGWSVLIHLGMSGRMIVEPVGRNDITLHEHIELETDDGWRVGFVDPRRFGSVDLIETDPWRTRTVCWPASAPNRWTTGSRSACWQRRSTARTPRSKPPCWTKKSSPGSGISTYVKRCSAPVFLRCGWLPAVPGDAGQAAGAGDQADIEARPLPPADRRCVTTSSPAGNSGISSTPGKSTDAKASRARSAPAMPPVTGSAASSSPARSTFYCPKTQR